VSVGTAAPTVCWGVFRETEHSPGRVDDDAAILRETGKRLEEIADVTVRFLDPGSISEPGGALPSLIVAMCEAEAALQALHAWERRGVGVVNGTASVSSAHRERAAALLEGVVPVPEGLVVDGAAPLPRGPREDALYAACWVKQATGHKTSDGSVAFASGTKAVRAALDRLRSRGVPRALVQRHVEGDWVKFYGVGGGPKDPSLDGGATWFEWFYPKERPVAGHPFEAGALRAVARRSAGLLGLEVWGGDAIVTAAGEILVIDVNSFPSFALYREEAARRIAAHLGARLRQRTRVAV